ncbi:PfkB family carbohydrate kinase [Parafilimonas sp.]|uniref:PfkB family carbohydrate kinase n=1 Tax=Parafilimonas sp. TaxID=1969739 RepID=UPI0039E6A5AB
MHKIFCFGEILMRMSPALNGRWLQQNDMPVYIGGAELNVATALAKWNTPTGYCTAMPEHYLSHEIVQYIRHKNIDTAPMRFSGSRIGIYFLPEGADLKHAGVIYDRAHSSFAELQPGEINWNELLKEYTWFHFSAISPAVSESAAQVCLEAVKAASEKNITVSVDLNYRAKLWKYGIAPPAIMQQLLPYCHVVMGNIWSANALLGIDIDEQIHDKKSKQAYTDHAEITAKTIMQQFPACHTVANTFRFDDNAGIRYYASLHTGNAPYISQEFASKKVIDKAGSGDCFMAGLIYAATNSYQPQSTINFAAAAAFGKLHEAGDTTSQTIEQIQSTIKKIHA